MVLVIGNLGNMGRRYCSILNMLRVKHSGIDKGEHELLPELAAAATKIILATPTYTHIEILKKLNQISKADILCEKPITKKVDEFQDGLGLARIFCVNQYAHLPEYEVFRLAHGRTYYNYFKHGDDGLAWDCFQLFALAGGTIALNESSPIWKCRINGVEISQTGMDMAYVHMVQDFLGPMKRVWNLFVAEMTTKKVLKWMEEELIPA